MSATFNWSITSMDCFASVDGESDVVFVVRWACAAQQQGQTRMYFAQINDITTVTYKQGEPFTPYNQLTQDQVLGWVWAQTPDFKEGTEASLQAGIDSQMNPVEVVSPPLPWSA